MLLLSFNVGDQMYALDSATVREVLPLLKLTPLPLAEKHVAGLLNFRGTILPVVDTCALLTGEACACALSTRIIIVTLASSSEPGHEHLLGLIAERVTETLRTDRDQFQDDGIDIDGAPFLGPVLPWQNGMLQLVNTDSLLPPAVLARLYSRAGGRDSA